MSTGEKSHGCDGASVAQAMLSWYDAVRRDLPWRVPPGIKPDPYKVWLSEIMLQQTTVKAVAPYYAEFLDRWPSVESLADTKLDEVLSAWAGLGYYARARNLHACAKVIAYNHGGMFPDTKAALLKLPGIGGYTAAAVAAIAYNRRAAVVDGNVERVLARFCAVRTPLPKAKKELREIAESLVPGERPGDFAQAMMDLGATVCTPSAPSCADCPLQPDCKGQALGLAAELPNKPERRAKPTRYGTAFFVLRRDGAILLRKRPPRGLLGGMTEVPGTPWLESGGERMEEDLAYAPVAGSWQRLPGAVRHTFTHFHLELRVLSARAGVRAAISRDARPDDCMWVPRDNLDRQALPSVMRKVVAHALERIAD